MINTYYRSYCDAREYLGVTAIEAYRAVCYERALAIDTIARANERHEREDRYRSW